VVSAPTRPLDDLLARFPGRKVFVYTYPGVMRPLGRDVPIDR
jgi:hypothetical protein